MMSPKYELVNIDVAIIEIDGIDHYRFRIRDKQSNLFSEIVLRLDLIDCKLYEVVGVQICAELQRLRTEEYEQDPRN